MFAAFIWLLMFPGVFWGRHYHEALFREQRHSGSASGNGEPRPKNRKMTGYPPMTQPSKSFEVETDCAAREERRILARRECGMRYHPALRPCFARHFGPGPR